MGTKSQGQHKEKRLSAAAVRNVSVAGFYGDGHGLYLKVDPSGAKRWVQRLVVHGKRRDLGLGAANIVSLADARDTALQNRKTARMGGDPVASRRQLASIMTFKDAAEKVHALHLPTWRNPKHGQQWINTLNEYVFPHFGHKRIDVVTTADVLSALSQVWNSKPETARRVKQRIGSVMKWAVAQGWRSDNPADAIARALPKHDRSTVNHHSALPYGEVANAIERVNASEASLASKLALEFMILTATRSGETRGASWNEIDLEKAEWIIPAKRMKAKRPHRVPLSARCLEILKTAQMLKCESGHVFPGTSKGKPLSDATLSKLLRELS
ncbi:MAG TPA: integrase arm-type DNA-binding domain-containing protein [Rhizomicrobium sp.]|jgi:integrase|nr:integrase arm-type DNA-binding domain-containing protein [Rhizomicrobium sp.]